MRRRPASILRAIATSPTDPGQVFEAILESALRLCGATIGSVNLSDGRLLSIAAIRGPAALLEAVKAHFPRRLTDPGLATRAAREGVTVHVPDVREDPASLREIDQVSGVRAELYVPMLREGRCTGALCLARDAPGLFSETQVALVRTLADQAVIAVENVRLFTELQEKNRALTDAYAQVTETLEQQTATSQILGVISSSPTDIQPVFDAIVRSAVKLCNGLFGAVFQFDGERLHLVAHHNFATPALDAFRRVFPRRPDRSTFSGRAILDGAAVHVPDIEQDPEIWSASLEMAPRTLGYRSVLVVPMLREGLPIGTIAVLREHAERFSEKQIALLRTFGNQAVIAIENVRLFNETKGGARAADGHRRDPAGDLELADRSSAGDGRRGRERCTSVRGDGFSIFRLEGELGTRPAPGVGARLAHRESRSGGSIPVTPDPSEDAWSSTGGRSTSRTSGPPRRSSR